MWEYARQMGGRRFKVVTVRGIPVYVGTSWLFIAAFFLYAQYVRAIGSTPKPTQGEAITLAVVGAILFFGAVLIHEGAHAVMARSLGIPVAGITLVFWGGATEAKASSRGPLGEFLVAFVGPASTLVLAGLLWLMARVLSGEIADLVRSLAELNLLFAGVNALPGFPLDGGRMLLATAWGLSHSRRTAIRVTGYVGTAMGVALAVTAVYAASIGSGWWLFVGYLAFIMISTGRAMEQRIALRDRLGRGTAADAMRPPPPSVPADLPLTVALDRYLRSSDGTAFPVVDQGRVIGTVSMQSARRVGARDPLRPVREGMAPLNETATVEPNETLDDVLEWLGGRDGFVLTPDGAIVGSISAADIERWFRQTYERSPAQGLGQAAGTRGLGDGVPPRPDL
jgi:Zn-dependent protease